MRHHFLRNFSVFVSKLLINVFYFLQVWQTNRFLLKASNNKIMDDIPRQIGIDHNATRLILLWTRYFEDPSWQTFFSNLPATINYDSQRKCVFMTRDQLRVDEADAVVFHSPDIDFFDVPSQERLNSQRWVYFALESPHHLHLISEPDSMLISKLSYNWTMSYSRFSDVWFPYGKFQRKPYKLKKLNEVKANIQTFKRTFHERKHDAVWIVSNCNTQSLRERVAVKLQHMGLDVDILGKCFNDGGKEFNESVASLDYSKYRYYFAFENSLCDEYVTEKVFQGYDAALQAGVIPVVYGASSETYKALLPPDSFIDVTSFKNVPELGEFLQKLSANNESHYKDMLAKFYEWQLTTELQDYDRNFQKRHYVSKFGFPALCEKLWTSDISVPTMVEDVSQHLGSCRSPGSLGGKTFFNLSTLELFMTQLDILSTTYNVVANVALTDAVRIMASKVDNNEMEYFLKPADDEPEILKVFRTWIFQ